MTRPATTLVLAVLTTFVAASTAQARCITRLPVEYSFPSDFAGSFERRLPITIATKGPPIRNLEAKLYTFGGALLGQTRRTSTLTSSRRLTMRLRYPLQPGRFTLTLFGEPNRSRSCGPKHLFRTVRFRDCPTQLPIDFPTLPQGRATDYGSALSVPLKARSDVLRGLSISLSDFSGNELDRREFGVLFGTRRADFQLSDPLAPGSYTVFVSGVVANQPASCGQKTAKTILEFTP